MPIKTFPFDSNPTRYEYEEMTSWFEPVSDHYPGITWEDSGASTQTDYWRAIYRAILERQEAAGVLSNESTKMMPPGPWCALGNPIPSLKNAIIDLIPRFVDEGATQLEMNRRNALYERGEDTEGLYGLPVFYDVRKMLNSHPNFRDITGAGCTPSQTMAWLLDAQDILNLLYLTPAQKGFVEYRYNEGYAGGYDYTWDEAKNEALSSGTSATSYGNAGIHPTFYCYTGGFHSFANEVRAGYHQQDGRLVADNAPSATILGNERNPPVIALTYATRPVYQMESVRIEASAMQFESVNFSEGYSFTYADHAWNFQDELFWRTPPVSPQYGEIQGIGAGYVAELVMLHDWTPCYSFT